MKKTDKKAKKIQSQKAPSSRSKIAPLGDRVLVRPYTEEERSASKHFGIIIPDSMTKEKSAEAKVLAVGAGRYQDGRLIPLSVKVGDTVIYSKYNYDEVTVDGEDLYIIREETILAVIIR